MKKILIFLLFLLSLDAACFADVNKNYNKNNEMIVRISVIEIYPEFLRSSRITSTSPKPATQNAIIACVKPSDITTPHVPSIVKSPL